MLLDNNISNQQHKTSIQQPYTLKQMSSDQQHPSPQSSYGGSPGVPQNNSNGGNAYGSSSQPTNTNFPQTNANTPASVSAAAAAAAAASKASFNVKTSKQILPFENEALRLKQKCKDLTQRIQDVEHNNEIRAVLVSRLRQTIKGLRFEYGILLEALERKANDGAIPGLDKLTPENLDPSDLEGFLLGPGCFNSTSTVTKSTSQYILTNFQCRSCQWHGYNHWC
ncbi:unnamed protein product [Ambrosiozyma monospora]|uniref:Unnamed protein product n=1 Tax=Ambrosiozyma monospora TaxID=43982 RepID=A0A9W7DIX2_AMBMO|nr:unnamed protein product [Ambrosiozyma monospora]